MKQVTPLYIFISLSLCSLCSWSELSLLTVQGLLDVVYEPQCNTGSADVIISNIQEVMTSSCHYDVISFSVLHKLMMSSYKLWCHHFLHSCSSESILKLTKSRSMLLYHNPLVFSWHIELTIIQLHVDVFSQVAAHFCSHLYSRYLAQIYDQWHTKTCLINAGIFNERGQGITKGLFCVKLPTRGMKRLSGESVGICYLPQSPWPSWYTPWVSFRPYQATPAMTPTFE